MQKEIVQLFGDLFSHFHMNTSGAGEAYLGVKWEDRVWHVSIKMEHDEDQTHEKNGHYSFRERFMGEFNRT